MTLNYGWLSCYHCSPTRRSGNEHVANGSVGTRVASMTVSITLFRRQLHSVLESRVSSQRRVDRGQHRPLSQARTARHSGNGQYSYADCSALLLYCYVVFGPSNRRLPRDPLCLSILRLNEIRKTQRFTSDVMQPIARLCNTVITMPVIVSMSMAIILWTNVLKHVDRAALRAPFDRSLS